MLSGTTETTMRLCHVVNKTFQVWGYFNQFLICFAMYMYQLYYNYVQVAISYGQIDLIELSPHFFVGHTFNLHIFYFIIIIVFIKQLF